MDTAAPKNPFRNPMGKRYLRGLFFEEVGEDKSTVVYTLKREDHQGFPSLYRLYMEVADPTEYEFATKHLDGWSHWLELTRQRWFQSYLNEWRDELITRLRSEAISEIISIATDPDDKNSYYANKYLLESLGKPTGEFKRGRPSKDEVQAELTRQAASLAETENDAKRIGLN